MSKTVLLFLVLLYGVVCLVISFFSGRGAAKTKEGYFMGGRGMGTFVSVVTVAMGILSGLAFFGSPALCMRIGNVFLAGLGFGITGLLYPLIGYKLWKYGRSRGYMTTGDFMRDRYYSDAYGILVAVIQVFFMIPYLTAQFTAIGNGLSAFTSVSFNGAVAIYGAFLIISMFLGGARGVGYMDVFNVFLGVGVPTVLLYLAIKGGGGADAIGKLALKNDPSYLNIAAGMTFGKVGLTNLTYWLAAITCVCFSPHIIGKMYMTKSKETFSQTVYFAPVVYMIICTVIVFLVGAVGIALYKPELTASGMTDHLVTQMLADHGTPILTMFLLWALLAFSMSTANAFVLSCATVISNDIVDKHFIKNDNSEARDRKILLIGKLSVIIIVVLGGLFSTSRSMFITDYAYAIATPGFAQILPSLLLGLHWRRVPKEAAISGTVAGLMVLVVTAFVFKAPLGVHQVIWSLLVNFALVFGITFVKRAPDKVVEDFFPETISEKAV